MGSAYLPPMYEKSGQPQSVQRAFYVDGRDMRSIDTFVELAKAFGLDAAEYRNEFESDELKYATRADFQLSNEMGVKGFPSVVIRHNGQLYMVANGFRLLGYGG